MSVPVGGIIAWEGALATVPAGFAVCDGSAGTPDLRDRFVVGAGSAYAVGETGGLAEFELGTHSHGAGYLAGGGTGSAHTHDVDFYTPAANPIRRSAFAGQPGIEQVASWDAGNHTHHVQGGVYSTSPTHTHAGGGTTASADGGTARRLPDCYAVYFIMRVA